MPYRVDLDRVRRFTLGLQHLAPSTRGWELLSVARRIGPVQARPTHAPYLAYWARMEAFTRQMLEHALYEEHSLVRIPSLHSDLHLVPAEDAPAYLQAFHTELAGGLPNFIDHLLANADAESQVVVQNLISRVLEVVSTRGPCTAEELAHWLPALQTRISYEPADIGPRTLRLGASLIPAMCAQGLLVYARPRGSWRSDVFSYASPSNWLPGINLNGLSPQEGMQRLVLDHIRAYGPSTVGDIVHWLGGVRRHQVASAIMGLSAQLARLQVLGVRGEYLVLADNLPLLFDRTPTERFVRLLPPRDGCLMAYRDPSRFVDARYRERVYDRAGDSVGVVLVDGETLGYWHLAKGERVVVRLFEPVDMEAMALVGEEARSLGAILADGPLDIEISVLEDEDTEGLTLVPLSGASPA